MISFIAVLGLLVFIHECGHFFAAKVFGVKVEEFGFGYPPRLIGRKFKDTIYSLNWIPVGGFVKIEGVQGGDQAASPSSSAQSSFSSKPRWQRFIILFAGIMMNTVLAGLLFSLVLMVGARSSIVMTELPTRATVTDQAISVVSIDESVAAYANGLRAGDTITAIDDIPVTNVQQLRATVQTYEVDSRVDLTVRRGTDNISVRTPLLRLDDGSIGVGAYFSDTGVVRLPVLSAIGYGFLQAGQMFIAIIIGFGQIVGQLFGGESVAGEISGPLGIASLTHQATQQGLVYLIQFAALLSVNLAVFNLLPIPALDGGRIAFLAVETIFRRPVNQKIEAVIHNIGFLLLLLVIMLVTIKDVINLF